MAGAPRNSPVVSAALMSPPVAAGSSVGGAPGAGPGVGASRCGAERFRRRRRRGTAPPRARPGAGGGGQVGARRAAVSGSWVGWRGRGHRGAFGWRRAAARTRRRVRLRRWGLRPGPGRGGGAGALGTASGSRGPAGVPVGVEGGGAGPPGVGDLRPTGEGVQRVRGALGGGEFEGLVAQFGVQRSVRSGRWWTSQAVRCVWWGRGTGRGRGAGGGEGLRGGVGRAGQLDLREGGGGVGGEHVVCGVHRRPWPYRPVSGALVARVKSERALRWRVSAQWWSVRRLARGAGPAGAGRGRGTGRRPAGRLAGG